MNSVQVWAFSAIVVSVAIVILCVFLASITKPRGRIDKMLDVLSAITIVIIVVAIETVVINSIWIHRS